MLTAGWLTPSARAASVKLCAVATAWNARSCAWLGAGGGEGVRGIGRSYPFETGRARTRTRRLPRRG